ncbi:transcription termination factor, mitochondrial-like [Liolophura sinensis]|uniref:transcription termination factor, mitochondrial-like n=1 Tax=Liolophura sinensis TaxID=3198878 RepID=UPI003158F3B7
MALRRRDIFRITMPTVICPMKPSQNNFVPFSNKVLIGHPWVWVDFGVRGYRKAATSPTEHRKRAILLVQMYRCPFEEANAFLAKNHSVAAMRQSKFNSMIELFSKNNITLKEIYRYPGVFRRNYDTISSRFEQLQKMGVYNIKLAYVNASKTVFERRLALQHREKLARDVYQDVPTMLMACLGISRQEVTALIERNAVLKESKLSTLKMKLELLVAQGVTMNAILEKTWILTLPIEQLESRARMLRRNSITFKKCSAKTFFNLLKCPNDSLEQTVENVKSELQVLGSCDTKEEFLCKSLHCDITHIDILKRSYSRILNVRATKLHATLTFLESCSVSREDIIQHGRLFSFSTETIENRHRELTELGCHKVTAKLLALDGRDYRKLVDRLKSQII